VVEAHDCDPQRHSSKCPEKRTWQCSESYLPRSDSRHLGAGHSYGEERQVGFAPSVLQAEQIDAESDEHQ
jgi:hypothetical protein